MKKGLTAAISDNLSTGKELYWSNCKIFKYQLLLLPKIYIIKIKADI